MTTPRRINVNRMRKNVGLPPITKDNEPEVDEHAGMHAIRDAAGNVIRWLPERSDGA